MKCESCNININSEFQHAISINNCPACGKNIMNTEKLANYVNLKTLLSENFNNIDYEAITNLIVANFDLKQLFKENKISTSIITVGEQEKIVVEDNPADPDAEFKAKQKADAKALLKKMRDEAYEEAIKDDWGLGEELSNDPEDVVISKNKIERTQSQENILNGTRGSFTRAQ